MYDAGNQHSDRTRLRSAVTDREDFHEDAAPRTQGQENPRLVKNMYVCMYVCMYVGM